MNWSHVDWRAAFREAKKNSFQITSGEYLFELKINGVYAKSLLLRRGETYFFTCEEELCFSSMRFNSRDFILPGTSILEEGKMMRIRLDESFPKEFYLSSTKFDFRCVEIKVYSE